MATIAAIAITMNSPFHSSEELFHHLLDESSALLAAPEGRGIAIPDDELHREIIVPLLPALLGDKAIRGHWSEQVATGFVKRIARHFENGDLPPRWTPGDFEIHVTASYSAGADARALADTLLSEDSLRDMTAALMNQILDALWPSLAPASAVAPTAPVPAIEVSQAEIPAAEIPLPDPSPAEAPAAEKIPEPFLPAIEVPEPRRSAEAAHEPQPIPELESASEPEPELTPAPVQPATTEPDISPSAIEPERAEEIQPADFHAAPQPPSRALIRALCGKLATAALRRGIAANSAQPAATSAAIVVRRIITRSACAGTGRRNPTTRGFPSRAARPGCR